MPYISISGSSSIVSTISIAFGTLTATAATTLTINSRNDNGTINTGDSTSVVTLSQQGVGSVVISSSTLTVSSGVATTTYRGKGSGLYTIIASSTGKGSGTYVGEITYNTNLYPDPVEDPRAYPTSGGGGAGGSLLRDTVKINNQTLYRIILWHSGLPGSGRSYIQAIIHDAKNVGVSSYLNEGGEMFFTLPYNHPQISAIEPLYNHYQVDRFDEELGKYVTIGQGILEDYDATENETVFYGIDYMGVLAKTITTPSTTTLITYNDKTFANIYQSEMSQAINESYSRLGFIDTYKTGGWSHAASYPLVINSATTTYDIFTGGESRGSFLTNLANIAMEGTTTKIVFGNTLESDTEVYNGFFCDMNWSPTQNNDIVLEYGGNVKSFSYSPNYRSLITRTRVVATSILSGVSPTKIWSSVATSNAAPVAIYGNIDAVFLEENLANQTVTDNKAKYRLYQSSPEKIKLISVAIKDGSIIPFKRYKLGDDIRVRIARGNVNIDTNLTLRGQRYLASTDGKEELWFDFFPRDTVEFTSLSPSDTKPPKNTPKPPRKPKANP